MFNHALNINLQYSAIFNNKRGLFLCQVVSIACCHLQIDITVMRVHDAIHKIKTTVFCLCYRQCLKSKHTQCIDQSRE